MDEAELVRRMRQGDGDALADFYARFLPTIWRFVQARLARCPAALREDVVSDTFLAALDGLAVLDTQKGPVAAWLTGIARHKVVDALRRGHPADPLPPGAADPSSGPAALLQDQELRSAVSAVMTAMNDEHRLVLEWKYIEGITIRAMAARLGRTEKAVEALLYRARNDFRTRFETGKGRAEESTENTP